MAQQDNRGDCGDLSAYLDMPFGEAYSNELKNNPDAAELLRSVHKIKAPGTRAAARERLMPMIECALARVPLYTYTSSDYAEALRAEPDSAGLQADLRRARSAGIMLGEDIVKTYPNARFIQDIHSYVAEMYGQGPASSEANLRAALGHVNTAMSLDTDSPDSPLYVRNMVMKSGILAELGEEAAALAVCDELESSQKNSTREIGMLHRAEVLLCLGKSAEAISHLEEIVAENPADSRLSKRAAKRLAEGRYTTKK